MSVRLSPDPPFFEKGSGKYRISLKGNVQDSERSNRGLELAGELIAPLRGATAGEERLKGKLIKREGARECN